jgi:enoyl-CoA hydratase
MSDDILFETRGALGLVTLNRPKAMNALTHAMALALEAQLDAWAEDPAVRVVAIRGAGEKAFCAGGDIRALHDGRPVENGDGRANFAFYADEYRLNTKIKRYPKPYVAFMDGVVMGGGVGVSIHGFRGASPATRRCSPCPRPGSACSPTSAEPSSCRACRERSGCGWR